MKAKFKNPYIVYMEEAGDDGAASGGATPTESNSLLDGANPEAATETPSEETPETPDWLSNKYMTDDRSIEEAISEQAKAYKNLESRFGSFTGAPEDYELTVSEELQELGVSLDSEDPLVQQAVEFAKEANMSQDGFNNMIGLYLEQQAAEVKADQDYKAEQLQALGQNSEARIANISQWASKNLDPETFDGLKSVVTSAEGVKAVEALIAKASNQSVDPVDAVNNSGVGVEELRSMQFEKDAHGNRKLQTDPAFRARYNKLAAQIYPGEAKQIVG